LITTGILVQYGTAAERSSNQQHRLPVSRPPASPSALIIPRENSTLPKLDIEDSLVTHTAMMVETVIEAGPLPERIEGMPAHLDYA
jgi:hypothetical protein